MITSVSSESETLALRERILTLRMRIAIVCLSALTTVVASATNIISASYDPETDEIVAQIAYRGTNPDHHFSLKWDECKASSSGGAPHQIGAQMLDSQWDDRALEEFKKTVRFSLEGLSCRPARVAIHTAAGFVQTLDVPAGPTERH